MVNIDRTGIDVLIALCVAFGSGLLFDVLGHVLPSRVKAAVPIPRTGNLRADRAWYPHR
jgi:hypothetical protein